MRKGEVVIVAGGVVVPREEILKYRALMGHIGIQIHSDFWIVPTTRKEREETGVPNHSCDPNAGFEGSVCYVAMRNIEAGEEITTDYAFMESEFEPFECRCGSKNCRKIIRPDDWKIPSLQRKYGQYFSPYVKNRFGNVSGSRRRVTRPDMAAWMAQNRRPCPTEERDWLSFWLSNGTGPL